MEQNYRFTAIKWFETIINNQYEKQWETQDHHLKCFQFNLSSLFTVQKLVSN